MTNYKKITKKEFDVACKKHLPSKWIRFAYKYFSKETEKKDMSLRNHLTFFLLGLFLIGFFGTMFNAIVFIKITTIIYSIVLSILVLYLFSAVLFNNLRLKRIIKILDINKFEYNYLINKFYK